MALEMEAGCGVWNIRKLHRYLFNVQLDIYTDHRSLEQKAKIGKHNPRVQRWLEFLLAYTYTLQYRMDSANTNADFLSRLPPPLPSTTAREQTTSQTPMTSLFVLSAPVLPPWRTPSNAIPTPERTRMTCFEHRAEWTASLNPVAGTRTAFVRIAMPL